MAHHRGCSLQRRLRQCGNVAGASGRIGCEQAVFLIGDGSVGWSRRRRRKRREQQGGGGGFFFSGVGVMRSAETVERRQEGADRWSVRDSIGNCRRVLLASGAGISCCGNCCAEIDAESLQQNIRIPLVLTPKVESRAGQDRRASLCDSNHSATFKNRYLTLNH